MGCATPRKPTALDAVLSLLAVRDSFGLLLRDERNDGRRVGMWMTIDFLCASVRACMLCCVG